MMSKKNLLDAAEECLKVAEKHGPDAPEIGAAMIITGTIDTCTAIICERLDRIIEIMEAGAPRQMSDEQMGITDIPDL